MRANLLLVMSLSGTVVFLLYVAFYPLAKRYFSVRWRYFILKAAGMFFLLPLPELKYLILRQLSIGFPEIKVWFKGRGDVSSIDLEKYIVIGKGIVTVPFQVWLTWAALFVMGSTFACIIFTQLSKYSRLKKKYLHNGIYSVAPEWKSRFNSMKDELAIKEKVEFVFSDICDSPLTVGVFAPVIVIPLAFRDQNTQEWRLMLTHELYHIKNKDLLIRFIALFIMALHWFNPVCYFLYHEICSISELYCDYCTVGNTSKVEIKRYSHLIVNFATEYSEEKGGKYFIHLINDDVKIMERRILEMKKTGVKKKVCLSCLVGGIICFAGGITTFAYNPPSMYVDCENLMERDSESSQSIRMLRGFDIQSDVEELPFDYFWHGDDGRIHEITDAGPGTWAYCQHQYVSGTIEKHTRYKDHSCKLVYQEAKECEICGSIRSGKVINTVRYDICPHE